MNKLKESKLNNKGFSLVELIIVIAIMAVLIGVLAPQYLKYVEKSRQSADLDNYDSIISAIQIYAADNSVSGSSTVSFTKGSPSTFATSSAESAWASNALADAGITSVTMKSTLYGTAKIIASVDSKGYVTIKAYESDGTTEFTNLNSALGF